MLKQEKKRLGKVKDRLIRETNKLAEMGGADKIHRHLIEVINELQDHINTTGTRGMGYDD